MANTTFNGPVRSQNGFQDISIDATTGAVTTDSTYATDATVGGSAKVTDGISNKTGVVAATGTILQMANGFAAAMVKNTHYLTPANGNAITATLPAQADSDEGDSIIVDYNVLASNGQTMKFGTAGEFFAVNSVIYKNTTVLANVNAVLVANGTSHDFLNAVGLTNAGPGIGSRIIFTYSGAAWRVEARLASSGTAAAAGTSVFATS
jgi:hypothetical protein